MTTTILPLPAGAIDAEEWQVDGDNVTRWFNGTRRGRHGVHIDICGRQDHRTGAVERWALIEADYVNLDLAGLREHAADVLATADEMEGLGS
jgi:hypothetical protein